MKTERIINFIKNKYPHLSRQNIQILFQEKKVFINGKCAKKTDWVAPDVVLILPEHCTQNLLLPNPAVACRLIKKTQDAVFFDKGVGVHSVAQTFMETQTAANWLLTIDPGMQNVGAPLESGLVHRLDYDTSGVMVAARHEQAYDKFRELFQTNQVEKIYLCVVSALPPAVGVYDAYADVTKQGQKVKLVQKIMAREKHFKKISTEILEIQNKSENEFVLKIKLITGFRHQIRAHLALLGCPIIGDKLYRGKEGKRLMLHSYQLSFKDAGGKRYKIKSADPVFE